MRRKLLTGILTATLLVTAVAPSFAATSLDYMNQTRVAMLRYAAIASIRPTITINNGTVLCGIYVTPKSSTSIDYVNISAKLINTSGKTEVKSWTQKVQADSSGNFTFEPSTKVSAKGSYYVQVTVKCYKNNKLVETLDTKSKEVQYKYCK